MVSMQPIMSLDIALIIQILSGVSCVQLLMFLLGLSLARLGRSVFCGHTDERLGIQYVHTHHVLERVLCGSYNYE